ncbi:major facilitator superfamily domain-containing protein [Elsinoe ampelina]|uniref:Major facilitator superfamily domain-containing protein n=1 Tax=Elsinoe ampelina TaxID=302913 RepID=A0A6A6FXY9_9PEZI|nr:major facilitator superfamily domain-containing protein [Elsinoe ampelina]
MDPEFGDDEQGRFQSITSPQLISVMVLWLLTGSCMSAVGVFIAPIKSQYGLGDGQAAIIFAASTCGYLAATATLGRIVARGWRTMAEMVLLAALIGSTVLSFGPPFPIVLLGYAVLMFGLGMGDSGFNIWASQTTRPHVVQGFMHSSFSLGSVLGPLLAAFLVRYGWSSFYRLMIFGQLACGISFHYSFPKHTILSPSPDDDCTGRRVWHLPPVWVCSVFFLFYVGSEAIFTDWGPEYARRAKGASSTSSSLASSLFWLGMAMGRLILGFVTQKVGARSVIWHLTAAACLQNLFRCEDLDVFYTTVFAIGFFLGPTFPSAILVLTKAIPAHCTSNAVAIAVAVGQVGAAVTPLSLGFLSDRVGLAHLPDVSSTYSILVIGLWLILLSRQQGS